MDELQELMEQRKKIDERIRQIKNSIVIYGCAKIDIDHYPTPRPDEWYVAVKVPGVCEGDQTRYRSIIRGHTRQECIDKIPTIIKDLQGLYDKLKENEHE